MKTLIHPILVTVLLASAALAKEPSAVATPETAGYEKISPRFDGMGDHQHAVTTQSELAQRYFNQGLVLAYGFNHVEAARSFRQVQVLDPDCAMGYWGEALVLGPNINAPMPDENVPKAWAALQKALDRADNATPRHRDYIQALAKRYEPEPRKDRGSLDKAYADAMRGIAEKYPGDHDAQALFAESLMDTTPWEYWKTDGEPKEVTREILRTLERVLTRNPDHPMANHLYIHAVEAQHPAWGEACADRLGGLVPGAGAEKKLRKAVEMEDALKYDEPPTWFIPPRQLLGAVLLKADKPAEAETAYREELKIYPDNGWSLLGLYRALKAQGKSDAAAESRRCFEKAWAPAACSSPARGKSSKVRRRRSRLPHMAISSTRSIFPPRAAKPPSLTSSAASPCSTSARARNSPPLPKPIPSARWVIGDRR